jgi:type II secretory pathway component PulC
MQHNYLKDKFVVIVLLGASAFLGIMILVKVRGFFVASAWAENVVKRAVAQSKADADDMEKYLAESKTIADELKKKNLFAPPTPKKHPVSQVSGILGDEVLIKDKWYKVGDKVGDAKIVAIEPTQVKIEWQGKEKVFAPISAVSAAEPEKVVEKAVVKEPGWEWNYLQK